MRDHKSTDDWDAPSSADWQPQRPQSQTFGTDFRDFLSALALAGLIGATGFAVWQFGFIPKPVIQIQHQHSR